MKGKLLYLLLACVFASCAQATPQLKEHHPSHYTVEEGDTLWDISATFLKNPWEWTSLWQGNPHIENPHLIYPGDELTLLMHNGQPVLEVSGKTVKLSPRIRVYPLVKAIPAIPLNEIKPFLNSSQVLTQDELKKAPVIVAHADEHVIVGSGDTIYVKGIPAQGPLTYNVYRPNGKYHDPDTNEMLGFAALHVGEAKIKHRSAPTTLILTVSTQEVLIGDRLYPIDQTHMAASFSPQAPKTTIKGKIIAVMNGVTEIGQHNVVVLNRGDRNNLRAGDVLAIYRAGRVIKDPADENGDAITLPDVRAGELMVFRTFPKVSYALVMHATSPIHTMDVVGNP